MGNDRPVITVYVDADACPVKEEVYRVARRCGLRVVLVANQPLRLPPDLDAVLVRVENRFEAADDWIAENAVGGDIVVSADIPLVSRCVARGARVLSPAGRVFTADNVGDVLALRNLLAQLREVGAMEVGGPPPFTKKDRSRFLQRLDDLVQALRRAGPSGPAAATAGPPGVDEAE